MTFGQKLKAARLSHTKGSSRQFSMGIGKDPGYILRLEQDKFDPRLSTIIMLAEKLGVPYADLMPDPPAADGLSPGSASTTS